MKTESSAKKRLGPFERDVTAYAQSCGYRGEKPVIVLDGRVKTHRNIPWDLFMTKVRLGRL